MLVDLIIIFIFLLRAYLSDDVLYVVHNWLYYMLRVGPIIGMTHGPVLAST